MFKRHSRDALEELQKFGAEFESSLRYHNDKERKKIDSIIREQDRRSKKHAKISLFLGGLLAIILFSYLGWRGLFLGALTFSIYSVIYSYLVSKSTERKTGLDINMISIARQNIRLKNSYGQKRG